MAEMTNGSYNAIDVLRATIKWTVYKKLAAADAPRLIWWGEYAKTLEPDWEWEYTQTQEEEFKGRLIVPNAELVRAGLHHPAFSTDRNNIGFFCLGEEPLRYMKTMKKSELDEWAETRLYEVLPWLRQ
jgi:hypothetical protein